MAGVHGTFIIDSFHLHANLCDFYRTGTRMESSEYTDVITMEQAERHILEFTYQRPGNFMFHAIRVNLTGLGWMGLFDVTDDGAASRPFETATRLGFSQLI